MDLSFLILNTLFNNNKMTICYKLLLALEIHKWPLMANTLTVVEC